MSTLHETYFKEGKLFGEPFKIVAECIKSKSGWVRLVVNARLYWRNTENCEPFMTIENLDGSLATARPYLRSWLMSAVSKTLRGTTK